MLRSSLSSRALSLMALIALPLLAGASCKDKSNAATPSADPNAVVQAADSASAAPDTTPLPGVEIGKLDEKQSKLFYKMVGSLTSPCGKAHSLRTSVTTDKECKRAPWAARYVAALIEDGASEVDVKNEYQGKYKPGKTYQFKLDGVPYTGSPDAPIVLVEFFDYGCPSCKAFKPALEKVLDEHAGKVVVYFKQFPLSAHPDSQSAAQAALAAHAQGKFAEMHAELFDHAPAHRKEQVMEYAKKIGLDMTRFEADYAAALPKVKAEIAEGDAADVQGTPSLYFNGRKYESPQHPRYMGMWIDEEMAVNR